MSALGGNILAGPRGRLRRGVAILPSLFTVANMFCGYSSVVAATRGDFELAVTLIVIAGCLDSLDGRIARMTNTTSEFGVQLDSLTDFLSFGVAPALILYHWGFTQLGGPLWLVRTGWLFPFLLPVAGALRLARFNVQVHSGDRRFFVGLPIPAAAAAAVLPLYFLPRGLPSPWKFAALCYVVFLAWLMVSRVKYRSFKDLDMRERRPNAVVFLLALILVGVAVYPQPVLLALALFYVALGPIGWIGDRFRRPTAPLQGGG